LGIRAEDCRDRLSVKVAAVGVLCRHQAVQGGFDQFLGGIEPPAVKLICDELF
jgi:hypothetical protein